MKFPKTIFPAVALASAIVAAAGFSGSIVAATSLSDLPMPDSDMNVTAPASTEQSDTISLSGLAVSPAQKFIVPASPDSAESPENPFSESKILENLSPLTSLKATEEIADYTILNSESKKNSDKNSINHNNAQSDENTLILRRYIGRMRPDAFFKGNLLITSPAIYKAYLDGKEVNAKSTLDSVAATSKSPLTIEPYRDVFIEIDVLSKKDYEVPEVAIVADADSRNVTLLTNPKQKTFYNIFTIGDGERINSVTLSPDGNYILTKQSFTSNGSDIDNKACVIERKSNRRLDMDVSLGAQWVPNANSTLYFPEETKKEGVTVITLEVPTMKRSTLADGLPKEALQGRLAPDASYIVFYSRVEGKKESGIMQRVTSPDDRQPTNRNRQYISQYVFTDKTTRHITYGGRSTYLLDISPDSQHILYSSTQETPDKFPFYKAILVEVNLKTLKTDTIQGIDASFTEAVYSPSGKELMIAAGSNAFNGIGLNAGNYKWGNDYDIQLYKASLADDGELSDIQPMTRDFNPSVMGGLIWNAADGCVYFRAQKGYDALLYQLNPTKKSIKELPSDIDFISSWSVSKFHPEIIAYSGLGYNYMGRAYTLNSRSGKSSLIADPNAPYMAGIEVGESHDWKFVCDTSDYYSDDNVAALPSTIEATYTLPPDFDISKKYPMIVYYYGGTIPTTHTNHSPYTPNLLASRGYVVLTINPSGTIGYGQEFSARHVNAWGDLTADEIIAGINKFCREFHFIDPAKIGCIGASYGGFMTQYLLTKTDLFAAAVSHAGISNIASYWGEGYWGYSYNAVAAARNYPWNNPELFTSHSPLFSANNIVTPLLLLHGNKDTNVPIGESISLYNALKLLGKDVEFITIDGSDHIVIDFQKRKEWHATIMAWFDKWLKNDSRWWDEIYK